MIALGTIFIHFIWNLKSELWAMY